jgi:hypothetical protein
MRTKISRNAGKKECRKKYGNEGRKYYSEEMRTVCQNKITWRGLKWEVKMSGRTKEQQTSIGRDTQCRKTD